MTYVDMNCKTCMRPVRLLSHHVVLTEDDIAVALCLLGPHEVSACPSPEALVALRAAGIRTVAEEAALLIGVSK